MKDPIDATAMIAGETDGAASSVEGVTSEFETAVASSWVITLDVDLTETWGALTKEIMDKVSILLLDSWGIGGTWSAKASDTFNGLIKGDLEVEDVKPMFEGMNVLIEVGCIGLINWFDAVEDGSKTTLIGRLSFVLLSPPTITLFEANGEGISVSFEMIEDVVVEVGGVCGVLEAKRLTEVLELVVRIDWSVIVLDKSEAALPDELKFIILVWISG